MTFLAPIWLIGLLPWAAVVAWLLRGRRQRTDVPFLQLWRGPVRERPKRRELQLPPLAAVLALLAALLALLAAARPVVLAGPARAMDGAVIVLDRGVTMSAQLDQRRRIEWAIDELAGEIAGWSGEVELVIVPGESLHTTAAQWADLGRNQPPTALITDDAIERTVVQHLDRGDGPVLLLSDRPLPRRHPRLVQVIPPRAIENVGLVHVAAREHPHRQLMLRYRNDSALRRAIVRISSAQQSYEHSLDLPPGGQEDAAFIDLPFAADVLRVELLVEDDLVADNAAWLVRGRPWPRAVLRGPLPAEVRRMAEVHHAVRPPGDDVPRVLVVDDPAAASPHDPAVIVAWYDSVDARADAEAAVTDHPVTRDVNWPGVAPLLRPASPPPSGWDVLVEHRDTPLLAVRERPARQVWMGFDAADFARTADFVMLWANVLAWVGAAEERFAFEPVARLGEAWRPIDAHARPPGVEPGYWPGLYERQGERLAINALDLPIETAEPYDWRGQLRQITAPAEAGTEMLPWLALLAAMLLVLSAATWPRRSP